MRRASRPAPVVIRSDGEGPFQFVVDEFCALGLKDAGSALHTALHDVHLRLEAAGGDLQAPTHSGAGTHDPADPDLAEALRSLNALFKEPEPRTDSPAAIGAACLQLGEWAEQRAGYRTALGFFQAAEQIAPAEARYAYKIGKMARRLAIYDAAQAWLEWASRVAGDRKQWEVAALAASGLGNLFRQLGNYPVAIRHHKSAERIARRHGLQNLLGDALYDLFVLSTYTKNHTRRMEYARQALVAYGPGHEKLYHLASDAAWDLMETTGEFESAARIFMTIRTHAWEPYQRVLVIAGLSRAAAAAGWTDVFEETWAECWDIIQSHPTPDNHSAALTELARGAVGIGDWKRAARAAHEALRISLARGEGEIAIMAESILQAIQTQRSFSRTSGVGPTARSRATRRTGARHAAVAGLLELLTRAEKGEIEPRGLGPAPDAEGPHSVFDLDPWSRHISQYATFSPRIGDGGKVEWERPLRFDSGGVPSFNRETRRDVPAPHVHDGSTDGGVRTPRPDELPAASWD